VKSGDGVIDDQGREQASSPAVDISERADHSETSVRLVPVPDISERADHSETSVRLVPVPSSVELFDEWVEEAVVAPPSLSRDMLSRLVRYGPDDLPEMLQIVAQAKRVYQKELDDLLSLIDTYKKFAGRQNHRRMTIIVHDPITRGLRRKLAWLEDVNDHLEEECEHYGKTRGAQLIALQPRSSERRNTRERAPQVIPLIFDSAGNITCVDDRKPKKRMDPHTRNLIECVLAAVLCIIVLVTLWYFFGQWSLEQ
jgi:hypothetical protein